MPDCAYGAVILAAGFSSRMQGAIKALLPVGKHPAIVRLVRVFQNAGIDRIAVVLGHYESEIRDVLKSEIAVPISNPDFAQGMYCSVQAGVRTLADQNLHGFFLTPVDCMLTQSETITGLLHAAPNDDRFVVYPVCSGMRGHPPLIGSGLIPDILRYSGEGGLQQLLQTLNPSEREFAALSETVLMDIDTRDEYENLLKFISAHPETAEI